MLIFYTVHNESLLELAEMFDTTVDEIKRLNAIDGDAAETGMRLLVQTQTEMYGYLRNSTLMFDDLSQAQLEALLVRYKPQQQPAAKPEPEKIPPDCFKYVVQNGETLYSAAHKHGTTPLIILRANNMQDAKAVTAGTVIYIPRAPENAYVYTVRVGDTPAKVASKFGISEERVIKTNYLLQDEKLLPGSHLLISV